jgi:flagellar motor switch/type III secretory pathway protein FliN
MTAAHSSPPPDSAPHDKWQLVQDLACQLSVELPVPGFRVRDLMRLQPQVVIDTHWPVGNDVPLRVNGELLAWCEFEVVENHLAVRLTELS